MTASVGTGTEPGRRSDGGGGHGTAMVERDLAARPVRSAAMAVLLGLFVALTYGAGDFCGGIASKQARTSVVVFGAFALSLVALAAVTAGWALVGDIPALTGHDLAVGMATGVIGPIGVGLLYRGLSLGRMSVVAPTTAVVAAVVPFAWGLAHGERPGGVALVGAGVAMVAVILISAAPAHPEDTAPTHEASHPLTGLVATAVASGLAFGVVFVLLASATADGGLWPLVAARATAVAGGLPLLVLVGRRAGRTANDSLVPPRPAWAPVVGAGVLDVTANAAYLAATRTGLLSVVAVVSSLYPASTVVLARVVLGERLHRLQIVGLVLAAAGVVALAT